MSRRPYFPSFKLGMFQAREDLFSLILSVVSLGVMETQPPGPQFRELT